MLSKKLITAVFLATLVALVAFRATHHPVYGKCHTTADGYVCTLIKWEGNK
jgi:hypothetical protein